MLLVLPDIFKNTSLCKIWGWTSREYVFSIVPWHFSCFVENAALSILDGDVYSPSTPALDSPLDVPSSTSESFLSHIPPIIIPRPVSEVLKVVYQTKCALLRVSCIRTMSLGRLLLFLNLTPFFQDVTGIFTSCPRYSDSNCVAYHWIDYCSFRLACWLLKVNFVFS